MMKSYPLPASRAVYRFIRQIDPCYLNDQGNLFGGFALEWMDEAAYIAASAVTKQRMVTRLVQDLYFRVPVRAGAMVEVSAVPLSFGSSFINVFVHISVLDQAENHRNPAVEGIFQFVSVDANGKLVRLMVPENEKILTPIQ